MSTESSAERQTETIPEWKRTEVDALVEAITAYESVGIVDIAGIPSRQLQQMRAELQGVAVLRVSRNTLVVRALEEVQEGAEELTEYVSGQIGIISTDENPFGLFRELEASKTPAPINPGEITPNEIVIPEGDTGVDPGPFVGELQQVGANARIDDGSIKVMEDSEVLAAGEEVDQQLANVLNELDIEPKEVGLDLSAVYADGILFEPEALALDMEAYEADFRQAAGAGRNLAINAGFPTDRTIEAMLGTAAGEAKSVGISAAIAAPSLAEELLARADAQLRSLASVIDDEEALPEELRGPQQPVEPAASESEDEDGEEEQADEEMTDADTDADESDDDEDGGDGDALGAMFG